MIVGLAISTILGDVIGVIVILFGGSILQGLVATMVSGVGCMIGFSIFLAVMHARRTSALNDDSQCLPTASAPWAAADRAAGLHGSGQSGHKVKHGLAREHHHGDVS